MVMKFKEWFLLSEGLQIIHIDPEEDWDYGEQAYQIAKMVNIRPSRNKNPTIIALNDKSEVIGVAALDALMENNYFFNENNINNV